MSCPQSSSILLKGGILLLHDDADHVIPTHADLLIEGNTITNVSKDIPASAAAKVVDCTSKIVSPGFVSTHAHLWQTQLKGRHPNHTLVDYMPAGCYSGSNYTLSDLFWGQLAGALEALDGGTTTVVDHAHLNLSPDYPRTAIQALATSGLRAVYCYTPRRRTTSFDPLVLEEASPADPAVLDEWEQLAVAAAAPGRGFGGGRVSMGFAMDNLFLPADQLRAVYARLRRGPHAARVITSHATGGPAHGGRPRAVGILDGAGLLGPDVLLSHAPGLAGEDVARLRATGARVSSTPNTEMQMGMEPVAMWRSMLEGGVGSLGVDCHSWGTSYLPAQMTLALQQRRLLRAQELAREGGGRWARRVEGTAEEAFNLGTVAGARAAGMAGEVGRLREGFRADVVVLDGESPGMLAAARRDPVAAVVLHSSVRDVDVVVVDGVVRKEGGRLCDVTVEEVPEGLGLGEVDVVGAEAGRRLSWEDVARETLRSREVVDGRIGHTDFGPAVEAVVDAWHMKRSNMVEM